MPALDPFDKKILAQLQLNARTPTEQLGAHIGLSGSAVQRRVKQLRDSGVIQAEVAQLDRHALGRPMLLIVTVFLERERSDIVDYWKRAMHSAPEVMNAFFVTGEADFVLLLSMQNMEEFEAFTRRFFYERSDIKGFKTMVVMDAIKLGSAVPVDLR